MNYLSRVSSTINTGASAVWHGSGASSVYQGGQEVIRHSKAGGTWSGLGQGVARMVVGSAALYSLPSAPLRALGFSALSHVFAPGVNTESARETAGPVIKHMGKKIGNQRLIDAGRRLHYGHLSADQLFQRHPSAFLRHYAIQSVIQAADEPGGRTNYNDQFQIRTITTRSSAFPQMNRITDSSNVTRVPTQHVQLVRAAEGGNHQARNHSVQLGNNFSAAFLPMLQAKNDHLTFRGSRGPRLSPLSVHGYSEGRVRDKRMRHHQQSLTVTTQLTGCSVTRQGASLMHIRPHQSGTALQMALPGRGTNTFGRQSYGNNNKAFVMFRRKANGRTKLYFQVHNERTNRISSGSRYV